MTAGTLTHRRCLNHSLREAVARCPECEEFFCRECITEHDDRVICSACLRKLASPSEARRRSYARLLQPLALLAGVIVGSLFFYLGGRLFVTLPSKFHQGTLWEAMQEP